MTVIFENESDTDFGLPLKTLAEEVVAEALDYIGCPYEAQVNVLLTDDEEVHRLNLEYRQIDRSTNVLSFPMLEYELPGNFDFLEEAEESECFDPDTGELVLGDIVLSAGKIQEQADAFGHGIKREYAFLIAHSMLHLMGFDHMTPEEASEMERLQEAVLERLQISR